MKAWEMIKKHRVKSLIAAKLAFDALLVAVVVNISTVSSNYIQTDTAHVVEYTLDVGGFYEATITEKK